MPTNPESRADGDALVPATVWPSLIRSGVIVNSEETDARYAEELICPVTAGNIAVTMVDTAEPPILKSNLPSRS